MTYQNENTDTAAISIVSSSNNQSLRNHSNNTNKSKTKKDRKPKKTKLFCDVTNNTNNDSSTNTCHKKKQSNIISKKKYQQNDKDEDVMNNKDVEVVVNSILREEVCTGRQSCVSSSNIKLNKDITTTKTTGFTNGKSSALMSSSRQEQEDYCNNNVDSDNNLEDFIKRFTIEWDNHLKLVLSEATEQQSEEKDEEEIEQQQQYYDNEIHDELQNIDSVVDIIRNEIGAVSIHTSMTIDVEEEEEESKNENWMTFNKKDANDSPKYDTLRSSFFETSYINKLDKWMKQAEDLVENVFSFDDMEEQYVSGAYAK